MRNRPHWLANLSSSRKGTNYCKLACTGSKQPLHIDTGVLHLDGSKDSLWEAPLEIAHKCLLQRWTLVKARVPILTNFKSFYNDKKRPIPTDIHFNHLPVLTLTVRKSDSHLQQLHKYLTLTHMTRHTGSHFLL